jgi:amicyanin
LKNKSLVFVVVLVVVIAAIVAAVVFAGKDNTAKTSNDNMSNMNTSTNQTTTNSNTKDTTNAVATNEVEISNFAFSPQVIKVKVGTKVTWTNKDSVEHTVTSDDTSSGGGMDSKLLAKNESYTVPFSKAGTFTYHCTPHPYMTGTVIVE